MGVLALLLPLFAGLLLAGPASAATPLLITADDQSSVYGSAVPALTVTYTGFVNGDTSANLDTLPTCTTTATVGSDVGGYPITCSGAVDPDYDITYADGNLDVTPAPLTVIANNQSKVYGSALPTLTASYTGFVNGDTAASLTTAPTLTSSATAASHVAGSPYSITVSGAADQDYNISYVTGNLDLTPAPLTISANDQSKPYGSAVPTLTASYTGFVNGDTAASLSSSPILTTTATAASHSAGSPYVIAASGAADSDYNISYIPGSLTVSSAALTISANNQTKVYGSALPALTVSYSGFVNGDTSSSLTVPPTLTSTATASSHVAGSPYSINPSGAVDSDYTISYESGNLSVTPAPLSVTANNKSKFYGSALPTLTASYSGFVNGDTSSSLTALPTIATSATSASHVAGSPYAITASGASDPDYAISYVTGNLSITPVPLTVTAENRIAMYGTSALFATFYSGFVNGDTEAALTSGPSCSTATSPTVAGSPYAITCAGAMDPDYTFSYVAGSLVITPAPLSITASDVTWAAGAAHVAVTPSYHGFVNSDSAAALENAPTCGTTAADTVGTFPTSCTGATDSDYTLSYVEGSAVVTAATAAPTPTPTTSTPPSPTATRTSSAPSATAAAASAEPVAATTSSAAAASSGGLAFTGSSVALPALIASLLLLIGLGLLFAARNRTQRRHG